MFHTYEIPIAIQMIELADQTKGIFQKYFCLWAAFNNIYTLATKKLIARSIITEKSGLVAEIKRTEGEVVYKINEWGYWFPEINLGSEKKQILTTTGQINKDTKIEILSHPNTQFFVERIPRGATSQFDSRGQLINGVLNLTRTVEPEYPVWSPINKQIYDQFLLGEYSSTDILFDQEVLLLYTIRNNLIHGDKNPNEANDSRVIEMALPILCAIVDYFIIKDFVDEEME